MGALRLTVAALLIVGVGAWAASEAVASDWPCWRGPKGDNISPEAGWTVTWPEGGPKKLWETQVGAGYSPVSVVDGRAYTMGNVNKKEEVVWCFDAATGDVLWKHAYKCGGGGAGYPGPRAQPTVDGDRLYTISIRGHLKCLKTESGDVVWEIDLRTKFGSKGSAHGHCANPVVLGKMLVVATGAPPATVMAFDKMTGKLLWKGGDDPGGYSTPMPYVFQGKLCLAVFTGTSMMGMDAADGRILWRYPWQSNLYISVSTPIISDNKVFFSCDYGFGGALLQITDGQPKELWRNTSMANHFNTCVLWKGYLYGFTPRQKHSVSAKTVLRCMEFATGKVKWETGGLGIGTLMVADGKLILLGDAGDLVIAEPTPEAYKPISRAKVLGDRCWTVPVLANGRIYCRDEKGHLVCLDVSR